MKFPGNFSFSEQNMDMINDQVSKLEEQLKQAQLELQRKEAENQRLENGNAHGTLPLIIRTQGSKETTGTLYPSIGGIAKDQKKIRT
jgi:hypothetical protein